MMNTVPSAPQQTGFQPTLFDGIFSFPNWNGTSIVPREKDDEWDLFDGADLDAIVAGMKSATSSTMAHTLPADCNKERRASMESFKQSPPSPQAVSHDSSYSEEDWSLADKVDNEDEAIAEEDEEWTERSELKGSRRTKRRHTSKRVVQSDVMDSEYEAMSPKRRRSGGGKAVSRAQSEASNPRSKSSLLWRKYGQKILRGKPWRGTVRCYYKCHHAGCPAKKLVEKHSSNLDKVIDVKYESTHNHPIADEDLEDSGMLDTGAADGQNSDDTLDQESVGSC